MPSLSIRSAHNFLAVDPDVEHVLRPDDIVCVGLQLLSGADSFAASELPARPRVQAARRSPARTRPCTPL